MYLFRYPVPAGAYYDQKGFNTLGLFQFQTLPMIFEAVDSHTFTEVLCPNSLYDLIDYFPKECIQREPGAVEKLLTFASYFY